MLCSAVKAFLMNAQVSRRQVMGSSALLSLSVAAKASFEEGYVSVSRPTKSDDDKFSIYYRMYSKDESTIPMVVVHGGPYVFFQY